MDVGWREPWSQPPALATFTELPEIRNPLPLSPISAMKTVLASVRLPAGRNPDRTRPRRPDPVAAHPVPIPATPVPESIHPNVPGAGRITHHAKGSDRKSVV